MLLYYQSHIPAADRRWVWAGYWAHIVSAFVLILLTLHVLGGGDMQIYYRFGESLAHYIRNDPGRWGPEVVKLILQFEAEIPIALYGSEGTTTTSMIGLTSIFLVATNYSIYGVGLLFSLIAFSGQLGMYAAFRHHFPPAYRARVLIGTLLVPSAVFWTSGVVKEAVALGGMGWMIYGLHLLICEKRRWRALFFLVVGGVLVAVAKSYILFVMSAAAGGWYYWDRTMRAKGRVEIAAKPFQLAMVGALAVLAMIGLGQIFPRYSFDAIAEETALLQERGEEIQGGSSYSLGDGETKSLTGQLAFAPLALTASLFRPFIFEAHNLVALINALETTVILWLWLIILRRRGVKRTWELLRSSPALIFCAIFVALFGLGVGLGTTNLGTLSRYRVPMMPLYGLLLLMLLPLKPRRSDGPG